MEAGRVGAFVIALARVGGRHRFEDVAGAVHAVARDSPRRRVDDDAGGRCPRRAAQAAAARAAAPRATAQAAAAAAGIAAVAAAAAGAGVGAGDAVIAAPHERQRHDDQEDSLQHCTMAA